MCVMNRIYQGDFYVCYGICEGDSYVYVQYVLVAQNFNIIDLLVGVVANSHFAVAGRQNLTINPQCATGFPRRRIVGKSRDRECVVAAVELINASRVFPAVSHSSVQ